MPKMIWRFIGILLIFVGFGHSYSLDMLTIRFFAWTILAAIGFVVYGENYAEGK